ncbi:DNA mismatch repair protein MutS [Sorangium cellulosum]|jgi:dsDNA-specific endonuclease/ATPase MutS2|uniref:DNA mismatch repair protein MutS n=1 Tax=Sorangium cellulosum TaxID=56 RepID=A0A4P2PVW0_SORCE|nr:Smr/MutS family protein [Sorangium cellulosum]AUX20859.1 DNA mismatch repair protein MutS [Sorangium cellulosum]
MLRRLRAWLDRALSPRAPAPPDVADVERPEDEPPGAPASPGDDGIVVLPIEDAIDLHTFAPRDVASVVEEYLHEAQRRGFREVRVIHGRGKGVQRRVVRGVLSRHPAVDGFRDAPASRGGWGATVVWLKPADGGDASA